MSLHYNDVKVSTSIPQEWADALDRLVATRGPQGKRTKAGLLRNGLRLQLQRLVTDEEEWQALDLGPIPEPPDAPAVVIDAEAVEIPLGDELGHS